jgi:hypothetical protein
MHAPLFEHNRRWLTVGLNAVAAVAVGVFVGYWVVAPALSTGIGRDEPLWSTMRERAMFDAISQRADPSPYRTATPDFDLPQPPQYGRLARQQAQTASQRPGREARDAFASMPEQSSTALGEAAVSSVPRQTYYPKFDRHKVY